MEREQLETEILRRVEQGLNRRLDLNELASSPGITITTIGEALEGMEKAGKLIKFQRHDAKTAYKKPDQLTIGAPRPGYQPRQVHELLPKPKPMKVKPAPKAPPPAAQPATNRAAEPAQESDDMANEWVNLDEAAKILGCARATARDRLAHNKVESRLGAREGQHGRPPNEYRRSEVEKLAAQRAENDAKRAIDKPASRNTLKPPPKRAKLRPSPPVVTAADLEARIKWLLNGNSLGVLSADETLGKISELVRP